MFNSAVNSDFLTWRSMGITHSRGQTEELQVLLPCWLKTNFHGTSMNLMVLLNRGKFRESLKHSGFSEDHKCLYKIYENPSSGYNYWDISIWTQEVDWPPDAANPRVWQNIRMVRSRWQFTPSLHVFIWIQLVRVQLFFTILLCLSETKHRAESPVSVWTQTLLLGGLSCGGSGPLGGLEDSLSGFTAL